MHIVRRIAKEATRTKTVFLMKTKTGCLGGKIMTVCLTLLPDKLYISTYLKVYHA